MINNKNTTTQESSVVKKESTHGIREDVVASLTESDIVAWIAKRIVKERELGVPVQQIEMTIWRSADGTATERVYVYAYDRGTQSNFHAHCESIGLAVTNIREQMSCYTPAVRAARKRAEAAALLAEADRIESVTAGDTASNYPQPVNTDAARS